MRLWGPLSPLCLAVALLVFGLDQGHKWWMLAVYDIAAREPVRVLPVLDLVLSWNTGISYGLLAGEGMRWLLVAASLAASAWLWSWAARAAVPPTASALGLIAGGALGNALDRIVHGAVADFFMFHWGNWTWYIFNLADVGIVAGVALLLYESVVDRRPKA